ncbi:MAG: hypothetical protein WDW36_005092 [Sanguina aurantia]
METVRPMALGSRAAGSSRPSTWRVCSNRQLERGSNPVAQCPAARVKQSVGHVQQHTHRRSSTRTAAAAVDAPVSLPAATEPAASAPTPAPFTRTGASAVAKAAAAAAMASRSHPTGRPTVASIPTFQEAISRLQAYWSEVGCAVWLPHNTEVGAGTMNPATFLRVLGPEPWSVCYAEPSVRPDDSRYGNNPNRVQRHTQFQDGHAGYSDPLDEQQFVVQVINFLQTRPDWKNTAVVIAYDDSDGWYDHQASPRLNASYTTQDGINGAGKCDARDTLPGVNPTAVHANGRCGYGPRLPLLVISPWARVNMVDHTLTDQSSITRFVEDNWLASQRLGVPASFHCPQVCAQGTAADGLKRTSRANEYEMSCYNLDAADIGAQRLRFALYEAEALRLLARRLPVPAYDHLLKLSHTFNILDARGAVGVTERANCFATLRGLAREITGLWVARREELGFPLGSIAPPEALELQEPAAAAGSDPLPPRDCVLELGCEELPPDDVTSALDQLRERVPALLAKLRLDHASVRVEGTPRRLTVIIAGLAQRQRGEASRMRGPPAKAAYAKGAPTKALEGFCAKNGLAVADVFVEADPKSKNVEYVWADVRDEGRGAAQVLTLELPALFGGISFKKSMRWRGEAAFSRPVRWLLALHGETVLPLVWAGLRGGGATRVLRNAQQPIAQVSSAEAYEGVLAREGITLAVADRTEAIWRDVCEAAAKVGGSIPRSTRGDLLTEVVNLVESPTLVVGAFEPSFLALPQEILVMVMRKHQRYFPIFAAADASTSGGSGGSSGDAPKLLPFFITVANGEVDPVLVAAGNEAVLRARFEDAAFFYKEDLKQGLESFRPKLAGTTFQKALGSLLDKSCRVEGLVPSLAAACTLTQGPVSGADVAVGAAAARLARADLASSTVMEMTALAGVMGRHYALQEGLDGAVAEAIFEAALPRQAGDILPVTVPGILVAVADRLDSIVGLIAAVGPPSATADPFALRRAAYGMLAALVSNGVSLSLRHIISLAAQLQPIPVSAAAQADVALYLNGRLEQLLAEAGASPEAVRAVISQRGDNPALAAATSRALSAEWAQGEGGRLRTVMAALARPTRIVRGKAADPTLRVDPPQEERALHAAYLTARAAVTPDMPLPEFLEALQPLLPHIEPYFKNVLVMCEDPAVRSNRLAFLRDIAALSTGVVDLAQLPGF